MGLANVLDSFATFRLFGQISLKSNCGAHEYGVADAHVSLLSVTLPALTFAFTIDRAMNGLTRPFFGWVSDDIDRENTMFIAFSLEAAGILALGLWCRDPLYS